MYATAKRIHKFDKFVKNLLPNQGLILTGSPISVLSSVSKCTKACIILGFRTYLSKRKALLIGTSMGEEEWFWVGVAVDKCQTETNSLNDFWSWDANTKWLESLFQLRSICRKLSGENCPGLKDVWFGLIYPEIYRQGSCSAGSSFSSWSFVNIIIWMK